MSDYTASEHAASEIHRLAREMAAQISSDKIDCLTARVGELEAFWVRALKERDEAARRSSAEHKVITAAETLLTNIRGVDSFHWGAILDGKFERSAPNPPVVLVPTVPIINLRDALARLAAAKAEPA